MTHRTIGLLVTLALGLLVALLLAKAQPAGQVPTIGLLNISDATASARPFEVFTQRLRELGYLEGQTIAIERRYGDGDPNGCRRSPPNSPPATSMCLW
jgi:putative tryptophan/tyrosine transport system substrate-binding protein